MLHSILTFLGFHLALEHQIYHLGRSPPSLVYDFKKALSKDLWQLYAPRMADYNQNFEEIKTALGESAFASAYAEGKAMTLDQGVAYALEISK